MWVALTVGCRRSRVESAPLAWTRAAARERVAAKSVETFMGDLGYEESMQTSAEITPAREGIFRPSNEYRRTPDGRHHHHRLAGKHLVRGRRPGAARRGHAAPRIGPGETG